MSNTSYFEQLIQIYQSQYLVVYIIYAIILKKATTMGLRYGHATNYFKRVILHLMGIAIIFGSLFLDVYYQYLAICTSSVLNLYLQAILGHFSNPMLADLALILTIHKNDYPILIYFKMIEVVMEHLIGIFRYSRFRLIYSTFINLLDILYFLFADYPAIAKPKKYFEAGLTIMVFSSYVFYRISIWLSEIPSLEFFNVNLHDDFYLALLKASILILKDEEKKIGLRIEEEHVMNVQFQDQWQITTKYNLNRNPLDNPESKEYKSIQIIGLAYLNAIFASIKSIYYSFQIAFLENSKSISESDYVPSSNDLTEMVSLISEQELLGLVKDQFQPLAQIHQPYDLRKVSSIPQTQDTCIICYSNARSIVLRPCNCFIMCNDCRILLAQSGTADCPYCRRQILAYSRLNRP
eukprot:NODE_354_length_8925_cov_1.106050.p3 type:complete len:408 gc:universal NODE_354_length_8925_cov_1.106050:8889-7666(-)